MLESAPGIDQELDLLTFDVFNRALSDSLRIRMDTMGVTESGAYGYYERRVGSGLLISSEEIRVFDIVNQLFPCTTSIHDIGGGIGSFAMLAAYHKIDATNIERNSKRAKAAIEIWDSVDVTPDSVKKCFSVVASEFPLQVEPKGDVSSCVAVITNLVGTIPECTQKRMILELQKYRGVVIDTQRFCVLRNSQEEYTALDTFFCSLGFSNSEVVLDLGKSGRYVSFH